MATRKAENPNEVPDEFMSCRSFRHLNQQHLHDYITTDGRNRLIGVLRVSVCNDCGTEIQSTLEVPSMRVVKSKYIHPDNYSVRGGFGVRAARREYFQRLGYKLPREAAE